MNLVTMMTVEAELTHALQEELEKLQGAPAGPDFPVTCLTVRNEVLSKHGVLLQDWIAYNNMHPMFGSSALAAAA